jgi:lipopolysaccharide export LptBFGC system permease protein LptF
VHWGVYRHQRHAVDASAVILITAIVLDVVVLGAFIAIKLANDPFVVIMALASTTFILAGVWVYLRSNPPEERTG